MSASAASPLTVPIAATTFLAAIGTVSGDAALALISAAGGAGAGYQTGKKTERRKNSDGGTENP
jgi:hypothetical protein